MRRRSLTSIWTLCTAVLTALCLPAEATAQDRQQPVFAYTSLADPDALSVVSRYFSSHDYISVLIARRLPELRNRIPATQQYKLVESLSKLRSHMEGGCNDSAAGILIYDIEKWDATPPNEQADPAGSINQGAEIIRKPGCQAYGIAPSRAFLSTSASNCSAVPGPMATNILWDRIDLLIIQAQGMLRQTCTQQYGPENYAKFIESISRYARNRNPRIRIFAEMSFRYTPAEQMATVIDRLGASVTGYYLAMPSGLDDCRYCSATQLESLLARYRQPLKAEPEEQRRNR